MFLCLAPSILSSFPFGPSLKSLSTRLGSTKAQGALSQHPWLVVTGTVGMGVALQAGKTAISWMKEMLSCWHSGSAAKIPPNKPYLCYSKTALKIDHLDTG